MKIRNDFKKILSTPISPPKVELWQHKEEITAMKCWKF